MSRLRDEAGWTLMELMISMTLFVVVLGATLTTFELFSQSSAISAVRADSRDRVRQATDRLSRELRNLASPSSTATQQSVDKATAYDIVFQNVDPLFPNTNPTSSNLPNTRRVRYCLDTTSTTNSVLWRQLQTWTTAATPAVPSTSSCPDNATGWSFKEQIADGIVNNVGGQTRPLFLYDSASAATVTSVRTNIFVDVNGVSTPGETQLQTGTTLRNQNRAPIANFTYTTPGNKHVLLNGSTSYDPSGYSLTYSWYDGTTKIGTGVTFDYTAPAIGNRTLKLTVTNPGALSTDASPQTVNVK